MNKNYKPRSSVLSQLRSELELEFEIKIMLISIKLVLYNKKTNKWKCRLIYFAQREREKEPDFKYFLTLILTGGHEWP